MDPEEQELLNDYRYRSYSSVIEKALRNFESSSEWADLISSLGKLNKALQSNLKYSLLPRRLIISKRLAQCLHPALPSGVHLKALETYEIIFKIVGTKWLAKDLFLYSCGLFPLLAYAAMSVRPVLLGLYEKYFLPLQKLLLPSLQAFLVGLLPGLEEGSEIYERERTDALLLRLSVVVGREVFYAALWGSVLTSPSIRLPASLFVVNHISRDSPGKEQKYMLGTDYQLTDPGERAIPLLRRDIVHILSAATQTLLRRDMSLNRRLYAWLLGSDIKGNTIVPKSEISNSYEDQCSYFFDKYSKDLLVEALAEILHQKFLDADLEERHHAYLKPFRILVSLLDKPEIGFSRACLPMEEGCRSACARKEALGTLPGKHRAYEAAVSKGPQVVENLFLEVIRAFYSYCHDVLGADLKLSYTQSGNPLTSTIKENRHASEIVKTVNLLVSSLSSDFLWDYMARCFEECFSRPVTLTTATGEAISPPPTVSELCTLLVFLLDVIPLELYSEVQTQYLPQVLGCLLQRLAEEMEALSLPELTHALKTCFKVLSKVQMPPSYLDMEPASGHSSPVKGGNSGIVVETEAVVAGDEEPSFPPLKSEDSGIGLSASSPELSEHLRVPRVSAERDDIWKKDGTMQATFLCIQELIANFASKNIFTAALAVSGEEDKSAEPPGRSSRGQTQSTEPSVRKSAWDSKPITVPQFKQMLSDLFTARGSPFKTRSSESLSSVPSSPHRKAATEWGVDQVAIELVGSKEDCREALAAACHLLLDCATFPVYLSEEETEQLCEMLFQTPGASDCSFPPWLKSLMTICCCVKDCSFQNIAIATLLEVINHSQSLALVIEDKMKRYKTSGNNPFFGKLQMVTVPPIAPGILKVIAEKTDFYQRVACVLWDQLNKETREHHITCVELFYRLHCLAPTANVCEDIICHALLDPNKGTRLEALSLFVVLDSLACTDGAISAAAQGWLVRALSLGDVARILEPMLLLLLQPKTQRTCIQCLKQENSAEDLHRWFNRKKPTFKEGCGESELQEGTPEGCLPQGQFTTVDREAIWAEVEKEPEKCPPKSDLSEEDLPYYVDFPDRMTSGGGDSSEHTESADTSSVHTDSENTSTFSSPSHDLQDLSHEENCCAPLPIGGRAHSKRAALLAAFQPDSPGSNARLSLVRADSDRTQASESLSSDEEADVELQAITTSRLLRQQREKQETVEALFKHILLYLQPYDSQRVLYAFSVLEAVLKTNPKEFIEAVSRTGIDTSSTAHLNLISNLLARHQEALIGQSFYGKLQTQAPNVCPHSLLIELLTYLCLSFLRSYYPCYLKVCHRDILGNRDVQVKSVEVLIRITTQLVSMAKSSEGKNVEFIHSLLQRCKVQEFVLLSLSASMYTSQKRYGLATAARGGRVLMEDSLFEESLINLGQDQIWSEHPLQIELLKLLQALIVLEHHLGQGQEAAESQPALSREWQRALNFQQAIGAMQYVQPHPLTSQGLLVSAVVRGLQPAYGYGMHPAWVSLVTHSLPYFGKSLGWTVTPFVIQICKNLDDLVKQYESESVKSAVSTTSKKENISPDYPLTLLEGLTTISHFCLLEPPTQHKKTAAVSDPINLRNAKNAILEELPRIVNTMALIWNVLRKEETQKRPVDLLGATKGSSSVYFKTTKTIRQKILDLLNPLTGHLGVQLIAAVATVWSRKQARRHSKTKMVPAAGASQHTLVDLVCALSTLQTDSVLQLVKEVVKRPAQIKGDEKSPLEEPPGLSVPDLQEAFPSLLGVLKEAVQLNLAPPGYFLLLSMLNDFVTRTPNLESKKDQKDLQEITQRILEAVGTIAGSSLEQTSWLSRNLEVKAQPQVSLEESDVDDDAHDAAAASTMVSASAPSVYSVQALSLLAEVLASLLDMVYRSDEKEKAVPLISRLLYYVFPYLRNHSAYNAPSFRAGAQLLSSLSGYAYTKRAWKKEVLELFLDPAFFQMDTSCVQLWTLVVCVGHGDPRGTGHRARCSCAFSAEAGSLLRASCSPGFLGFVCVHAFGWKSIIDHLLTHEKTMFKDLMNMQSSSLKLFSSFEQKAMLLKRQAFAVFSGELDQYHLYLPLIQERLTDNLRVGQTSIVAGQMFLFFRVLLLRISPQHLTSLWPIMVSELIQTFIQLEEDLKEEDESRNSNKINRIKVPVADGNGPSGKAVAPSDLTMYLSACKFLDTALSFPPDKMPLFQIYRWAFVPEVDTEHPAFPSELEENHQECRPHTVRILELLRLKYREIGSSDEITRKEEFPLLRQPSVSCIRQLMPFFTTLNCAFKTQSQLPADVPGPETLESPVAENPGVLRQLEECVEQDFLEHPEC
ncbi:Protein dopey-2 [Apodemus speciosus]|uniref:Protein dopey-2 n=1 Tax=Apodemus speciosus TaxID=105296 RepID=A0ABQ0FMG9_APOSI